MFRCTSWRRKSVVSLLAVFAAGATASARPAGSLTFTKGWVVNTANVTGAAGKTSWTMQTSLNGTGPWTNTTYTGTVGAGGTGSTWGWNAGGPPWSGDGVRAVFDNGSTSAPGVAQMGNVNIQDATYACASGTSQNLPFPLTLAENFQANLEFGTVRLVPGSVFTIGLPEGFSWPSTPTAVATDPSDLTVALASVSGRDLNIPIVASSGINPFAGFQLNNSLISFSGNSPTGDKPFFTLSGSALYNGSPTSFSFQWQPVTVTPAPGSIALVGVGLLGTLRRRRSPLHI